MRALDQLISLPRLLELDHVDLAAPPERVWDLVRHGDLARSPLVRALFKLRTLPDRIAGRKAEPGRILLDDLVSSPEQPGFQILIDDPPREVAVGAIGKVWHLDIPFVHVGNAQAYARFEQPDFVKVAWAVRVMPRGEQDCRVELEVRVEATDEGAWQAFRRYFLLIGPFSRFIRRSTLKSLARELGDPAGKEEERFLAGDELLPDAAAQITHGITIGATPQEIWPWLTQMGCRRAGYYSIDALDNGGMRSARELHPEMVAPAVGEVLPATVEGTDGFEVLAVDQPRALVLGGLFDAGAGAQRRFRDARPEHYWHVTWAFVLEPLDDRTTRLHVRARAAFSGGGKVHAAGIRPIHHLMQTVQLRNLAARAEGRLARDDWRDVMSGAAGAALMAFNFLTPFRRGSRSYWGLDPLLAERYYPGDDLIPEPRWSWTHGVEIGASAGAVWGWVAQVGADRGGFYSYQWLENVAGCGVRNAERVHPEWELRAGDHLLLHPRMPPLAVVESLPPRHLLVLGAPDSAAMARGRPWAAASWLFFIEDLGRSRCRLVSRFRSDYSDDLATRVANSPGLIEPIGFAMDRRMLLGIKARVEEAAARLAKAAPVSGLPTTSRASG
jgi:hypothetical protein